jgi:hypothetical protein
MAFPDEISQLIDWVDQPIPPLVKDMHTLDFSLQWDNGYLLNYYGQLFYQPKGPSSALDDAARLQGGGFIFPWLGSSIDIDAYKRHMLNVGQWVRVIFVLAHPGSVLLQFYYHHPAKEEGRLISDNECDIDWIRAGPTWALLSLIVDGTWRWSLRLRTGVAAP